MSKDPWFRPVDIKLGPDGALYVTDFYNKIIGHYEVDLKHPQRDKDRGRVWRIVWKGKDGKAKAPEMAFGDLTKEKSENLGLLISHPNLITRHFVLNELLTRDQEGLSKISEDKSSPKSIALAVAASVWLTGKRKTPHDAAFADSLVNKKAFLDLFGPELTSDLILPLWIKSVTRFDSITPRIRQSVIDNMNGTPFTVRAVVDVLTAFPSSENIPPLVDLLKKIPAEDSHLRYAARVALRNSVAAEGGWKAAKMLVAPHGEEASRILADVALAIPSEAAGDFIALHLANSDTLERGAEFANHIGRYFPKGYYAIVSGMHYLHYPGKPRDLAARFGLLRAYCLGCQSGGHKIKWNWKWSEDSVFTNLAADLKKDPEATTVVLDTFSILSKVYDQNDGLIAFGHHFMTNALSDQSLPDESRAAAANGLAKLGGIKNVMLLGEILQNPKTKPLLKERILVALAGATEPSAQGEVKAGLRAAPYRVVQAIAAVLVDTGPGTETLFEAVRTGAVPARVLQDKVVAFKLALAPKLPNVKEQVAELTKGLPPSEKRLDDLIKKRQGVHQGQARPEARAQIYAKSCAACHQVGGQGGKVGPNLDGIGTRGAERLLEDVLDPNRNVDAAFRARVLNLVDGRTVTGLMLRVEGKVVVMADAEGKEVRVPEADIEKNTVTNLSPMPANFDTAVSEADFVHLLGYLLELRGK